MEKNDSKTSLWRGRNTRLIVVRSDQNSGKTTTIGMVLEELLADGATLRCCNNYWYGGHDIIPAALSGAIVGTDFYAELDWNGKFIIMNSAGDIQTDVQKMLNHALPQNPDYLICASRSQNRKGSSWELFETIYTNILYRRVCFWSEYSAYPKNKHIVKEPTVEAIIKYMK